MSSRALLAPWAFALLVNFGCGRSAEEKQLDAMRDEIDKAHQGRDHADREGNVRDPGESSLVVPTAYASAAQVRSPPTVVQLGPDAPAAIDDSTDVADPQDTTPRPTIRVLGSVRSSGRNVRRGEDQIEQTGPDDGTSPPNTQLAAHAIDPEAKRAYDAALALVNAKRFDQALDALAAFLVKWPDHPYANNAMYWRGECYFARGEYQKAAEQFDGVVRRFPAGNKASDALLKLGMSHQRLGNAAKAKECFDRLAQQYPDSDAARRLPAVSAPAVSPPGPPQEARPQ